MRYIIVPLLIILYSIWSYNSIETLLKNKQTFWRVNDSARLWFLLHIALVVLLFMLTIVYLIIKYW